jgi:cyclopropane fatty-acyl-phospholipid synthase-like methyltransferase
MDMGCGSGLNSRFLARQGFRVVAMDLALSPLAQGNAAAQVANLPSFFCMADVTAPPLGSLGATFALDIGCFHAVLPERRTCYEAALARLLASGAHYLLYAFEPQENEEGRSVGIGPETLQSLAPDFSLRWVRHGHDQDHPSAWYLFRRR